ncbi:MAG: hypothetical protein ACXAEN_22320 [Candidatus Thorarchaeota archaeon]|jgi:hypothetical protein
MDFIVTPEIALAISFLIRDTVQSLLHDLSKMTPEEREAWRAEQMRLKAEHDKFLEEHLGGGP